MELEAHATYAARIYIAPITEYDGHCDIAAITEHHGHCEPLRTLHRPLKQTYIRRYIPKYDDIAVGDEWYGLSPDLHVVDNDLEEMKISEGPYTLGNY